MVSPAAIEKARCPICYEDLDKELDNPEINLHPDAKIAHIFHQSCIGPWLQDHTACPVCRETVNPEIKKRAIKPLKEYTQRLYDIWPDLFFHFNFSYKDFPKKLLLADLIAGKAIADHIQSHNIDRALQLLDEHPNIDPRILGFLTLEVIKYHYPPSYPLLSHHFTDANLLLLNRLLDKRPKFNTSSELSKAINIAMLKIVDNALIDRLLDIYNIYYSPIDGSEFDFDKLFLITLSNNKLDLLNRILFMLPHIDPAYLVRAIRVHLRNNRLDLANQLLERVDYIPCESDKSWIGRKLACSLRMSEYDPEHPESSYPELKEPLKRAIRHGHIDIADLHPPKRKNWCKIASAIVVIASIAIAAAVTCLHRNK